MRCNMQCNTRVLRVFAYPTKSAWPPKATVSYWFKADYWVVLMSICSCVCQHGPRQITYYQYKEQIECQPREYAFMPRRLSGVDYWVWILRRWSGQILEAEWSGLADWTAGPWRATDYDSVSYVAKAVFLASAEYVPAMKSFFLLWLALSTR